MRFGVIGTGRITQRLVVDLQSTDGAVVQAIGSRDSQRARWYADQFGVEHSIAGYDLLLERDDIDAVYIAVPPSLHTELAIQAAGAGKHILCEKPLATSTDEAVRISDACARAGVRWLDATGWLHHSRTKSFATWISNGRLGQVGHVSAAVSFHRPFQTEEHRLNPDLGGGCLLDLGWYVGGLARFATGGLPNRVFGDAVMENGVPIRLTGMMWFDNNVTATISCGYDTATRKWFEIAGSEASLVCDDFTRPWPDRPARCWIHAASGAVDQEAFDGCQEREMIRALIGDGDLSDLHCQALDTHRILDALLQSIGDSAPVEVLND